MKVASLASTKGRFGQREKKRWAYYHRSPFPLIMPALALTPTPLEDAMPAPIDRSEVADRIAIMRIQEETTYNIHDYLADSVQIRKMAAKPVDEDCRVKMCEWCYQVVDFCKFRRETVGIGMSYLDRYLCTLKGRDALCNRKEYQLAAMTALYIAIKLHEPLEMETSLLADLSRGCYTEMEFVGMEQTILQALKFRVNGPTALGFVLQFMSLVPSTIHPSVAVVIMDYARFQTELAVSDHKFVAIKPSELGLAAVLNALEALDQTLLPLKAHAKFIRSIEKYAEVLVEEVEATQTKLGLLLLETMSGDYSELVSRAMKIETPSNDDKFNRGNLNRRYSPVSVVRR